MVSQRLNRAIILATEIHAGQTDKAGAPYILHPLRVMLMGKTEPERIVGVLHDVIEDAPDWKVPAAAMDDFVTLDELRALNLLTRVQGDTYALFISCIAQSGNQLAIRVKINDITDNLRPLGRDATRADLDRVERYHKALATLMDAKD